MQGIDRQLVSASSLDVACPTTELSEFCDLAIFADFFHFRPDVRVTVIVGGVERRMTRDVNGAGSDVGLSDVRQHTATPHVSFITPGGSFLSRVKFGSWT